MDLFNSDLRVLMSRGRQAGTMKIIPGIAVPITLATAAVLITVLAIAAIRRDRGAHHGSGSLGAAMLEVHSLLEPAKRHALKSVRADDADEDSSPDDPPIGGRVH